MVWDCVYPTNPQHAVYFFQHLCALIGNDLLWYSYLEEHLDETVNHLSGHDLFKGKGFWVPCGVGTRTYLCPTLLLSRGPTMSTAICVKGV